MSRLLLVANPSSTSTDGWRRVRARGLHQLTSLTAAIGGATIPDPMASFNRFICSIVGGLEVDNGSSFNVIDDGETLVVSIVGIIDLASRDAIWNRLGALLETPRAGLTIDLSGATFMDSRGMGVLLRARSALGAARPITLLSPPSGVRRPLEVLEPDEFLRVELSEADCD